MVEPTRLSDKKIQLRVEAVSVDTLERRPVVSERAGAAHVHRRPAGHLYGKELPEKKCGDSGAMWHSSCGFRHLYSVLNDRFGTETRRKLQVCSCVQHDNGRSFRSQWISVDKYSEPQGPPYGDGGHLEKISTAYCSALEKAGRTLLPLTHKTSEGAGQDVKMVLSASAGGRKNAGMQRLRPSPRMCLFAPAQPLPVFNFLVHSHVDPPPRLACRRPRAPLTTMSLEPFPVSAARATLDELEPFDPELLSLIAADDNEALLLPMEDDVVMKKVVDDYAPLNPTSTPTAVENFNPGFSRLEVEDLMNLFAPDVARIPTITRSVSEPIKKLGKRTKKCTYAARRREVAFLRRESMVLEKRLNDLRKHRNASTMTRDQAANETYELAKAQAENERLRAMVSTQEAKIRKADAYMNTINLQRRASSP